MHDKLLKEVTPRADTEVGKEIGMGFGFQLIHL